MERSLEIATGESVAFRYELAGVGSRFIGVVLDLVIQVVTLAVLVLVFGWVASALDGFKNVAGALSSSILEAAGAIALFLLFFGYFIVMEWLWDGRTPGKRIVGIRVIRDGGFPLDFTASVVRNVVRLLEFALGFYALSALSAVLSPSNRRLGDYAAGTIVVRDERRVRDPSLAAVVDDGVIARITLQEREIAIRYVARRGEFDRRARITLAARLAAPLRPRVDDRVNALDDDALLQYVAAAATPRPESVS